MTRCSGLQNTGLFRRTVSSPRARRHPGHRRCAEYRDDQPHLDRTQHLRLDDDDLSATTLQSAPAGVCLFPSVAEHGRNAICRGLTGQRAPDRNESARAHPSATTGRSGFEVAEGASSRRAVYLQWAPRLFRPPICGACGKHAVLALFRQISAATPSSPERIGARPPACDRFLTMTAASLGFSDPERYTGTCFRGLPPDGLFHPLQHP